ncbi:recombinase family protein (plasmid) [Mycobacterium avium subsp. hominissuis]|nr:recombinase family protein [Mycobacterium avium subsp. hominissuis]
MAVILGYARVSSTGQDLDAQLAALAAAGVDDERVYTDKLSGAANTDRPGLAALLDYARAVESRIVV